MYTLDELAYYLKVPVEHIKNYQDRKNKLETQFRKLAPKKEKA